MKDIYLSVVIPVYNESERLHHLKQVKTYLEKQSYTAEIVVVNDGSTDDTLEKLKIVNNKGGYRIISYTRNLGKGYAVKKGMLAAIGDYRLFMDVDLSTPIEELGEFLPLLDENAVVIGTRKNEGAKIVVHQTQIREALGKGFTYLSQQILGVKVSDFTCGFKCFSMKAAKKIFSKMVVKRWGFDSEVLYLAKKYGFVIKEVAVTWRNDSRTKVKFPQDILRSLSELFQVVVNDRILHLYD